MALATRVLAVLGFVLLMVPMAAASNLPTGTHRDGNCVWVYDFPDAGYALCTGRADCPLGLYSKRVTFIGTEEQCVL